MIKTKSIFFSFLAGGAIGSVIALLYAPKPGKHLRNDIAQKTNKMIDEGKRKTSKTWNGAKDKVERTIENANEYLNEGLEKVARKSEKIKSAFKTGMDAYSDERKSGDNQSSTLNEDNGSTHNQIT